MKIADELMVRVLQGTASDIERRQLLESLKASLRDARRFRELEAVWGLTGLHGLTDAGSDPPSTSTIVRRASGSVRRAGGGIPRVSRRFVMSSAAALLLLAGVGAARSLAWWRASPAPAVTREVATTAARMITEELDDGTMVRLGPESRLRFGRPSYGPREVWLEGRAYFAVAKRDGDPFRIHTSAGEVLVMGTRFEMETASHDLRLRVIQGRVKVSAGDETVNVEAGHMTSVTNGGMPVVADATDAFSNLDAWVGHVVFFESTPLDQVARELSAHYGRQVTLGDSALASRTLTASFENRSFEDVLAVVCRIADARCVFDGTSATIRL